MDTPLTEIPIWVIAIDYLLGMVMWTLIGRTAMGFFLPQDSNFFFMKFFVRVPFVTRYASSLDGSPSPSAPQGAGGRRQCNESDGGCETARATGMPR
jgi:hypothetical protein